MVGLTLALPFFLNKSFEREKREGLVEGVVLGFHSEVRE